jgi:UDP-glucose 4-epimerase
MLIASSDKIRKDLGWKPERQDLKEIIESAWKWLQKDAKKSAAE